MGANNNDRAARRLGRSSFSRYILKPFFGWWAREAAFSELMSLDDNTLNDIGVARCEIPGLVRFKIVRPEAANDERLLQSRAANDGKDRLRRG